jgi:hypothetical protein
MLETLLYKRSLYQKFYNYFIGIGYTGKDTILYYEIEELNELIKKESFIVLSDLLRKTYYRLLLHIDKGEEYLIDILKNPRSWVLNPIEKDMDAWVSNKTLIFSTETKCAAFSHIDRDITQTYKYQDNKWQ